MTAAADHACRDALLWPSEDGRTRQMRRMDMRNSAGLDAKLLWKSAAPLLLTTASLYASFLASHAKAFAAYIR